jgi:hypothetical protein
MKPGAFGASTEVLPHALPSACIAPTSAGSVSTPGMTSTSFIRVTGLKKCQPTTRRGCARPCAIAVIEIDEVLVASTASGASTFSSSANSDFFASSFSTIASTASPQPASAAKSATPERRLRTAARSASSMRPRFTAPARSASMRPSARSDAPGWVSNSRTGWPDCAANCAMPAPMLPAPMTATGVSLSIGYAIQRSLNWAGRFAMNAATPSR